MPYPVPGTPPEPKVITKVIKYNKRVPVPVVVHKTEKIPVPVKRTKIVKVKVPVPSPPKIVYKKVKVMSHPYDCKEGLHSWQDVWSHSKRLYCCWKTKVGCPHSHTVYHTKTIYHTKIVPRKVHLPPKIIYKENPTGTMAGPPTRKPIAATRQRLAALEPGMASCMATANFIWNMLVMRLDTSMTARPVSPIGFTDGQIQRRPGAATRSKGAV